MSNNAVSNFEDDGTVSASSQTTAQSTTSSPPRDGTATETLHLYLAGSDRDDVLVGGAGDDTLYGGAGNDTLRASSGNDVLEGGDGLDHLLGGAGDDLLRGDRDADTLEGGEGADRLDGGEGDDLLLGGSGADILHGGAGHDVLRGGDDDDRLYGDDGDDTLNGGAGADLVHGGAGADTLAGGTDDDRLIGGDGDDLILGEHGDDIAFGGEGRDALTGHGGADRLFGEAGDDLLEGASGDDILNGGEGDDTLDGGTGRDHLRGGAGADLILGGGADDVAYGGDGNDVLDGGAGRDRLYGEAGNDTLLAGEGGDVLDGGAGDDTFRIDAALIDPSARTTLSGDAGHDVLVLEVTGRDDIVAEFGAFRAGEAFTSATLGTVIEGIEEIRFVRSDAPDSEVAAPLPPTPPQSPSDPVSDPEPPAEGGARADRFRVDDVRLEGQPGITMPGTGREYVPILLEDFDYADTDAFIAALNDGTSGVWSSDYKNGWRVATGPHSVSLDPTLTDANGEPIGLNPFSINDGVLTIQAGLIPEGKMAAVREAIDTPYSNNELWDRMAFQHANDPNHVGGTEYYYSGAITTHQSWAESYGYFEIKTTLPKGAGHFPAFWLTNASQGWPPEIDILEAVGHKNEIVSTVIFNQYGQDELSDTVVYDLDFINDRGLDFADRNESFDRALYEAGAYEDQGGAAYRSYSERTNVNGDVFAEEKHYEVAAKSTRAGHHSFKTAYVVEEALAEAGLLEDARANSEMMYAEHIVYAAEWTPDEIIWYVGLDSDNLVEVFRSETPADDTTLQYIVANLEFGGSWPGYPLQSEYDEVFAQTMDIDHIKIYALAPDNAIVAAPGETFLYGTDRRHETVYENDDGDPSTPEQGAFRRALFGNDEIIGNARGNVIEGGSGFDEFTGGAGADTFIIGGTEGNKVITDFDPAEGDSLLLHGFHIEGTEGALKTLTQVGDDVWLIKGSDPHNPQTIVLRDIAVGEITADALKVIGSVTGGAQEDEAIFKTVGPGHTVHGTRAGDKLKSDFMGFDGERVSGVDLAGGRGEDLYLVRNGTTKVIERANEGFDTIETNRDTVLPANVEGLIGTATGRGQTLTGNALDNTIVGTVRDDVIAGRAGNDALHLEAGGADIVRYRAGEGADMIVGFGADDVLSLSGLAFADFAALQDRLVAAGRDTVLILEEGEGLLFRDVARQDLTAENFAFQAGPTTISGTPDLYDFMLF